MLPAPSSQRSGVRRQAACYATEPAAGKPAFQGGKGAQSVNSPEEQCILPASAVLPPCPLPCCCASLGMQRGHFAYLLTARSSCFSLHESSSAPAQALFLSTEPSPVRTIRADHQYHSHPIALYQLLQATLCPTCLPREPRHC